MTSSPWPEPSTSRALLPHPAADRHLRAGPGLSDQHVTMLEAVLGRLDNLSEWEVLSTSGTSRATRSFRSPSPGKAGGDPCRSGEVGPHPRPALIRRHFKGDLMTLRETLRSLGDLASRSNNTRPSPSSTRRNTSPGSKPCEPTSQGQTARESSGTVRPGERGEFERHQKQPPTRTEVHEPQLNCSASEGPEDRTWFLRRRCRCRLRRQSSPGAAPRVCHQEEAQEELDIVRPGPHEQLRRSSETDCQSTSSSG